MMMNKKKKKTADEEIPLRYWLVELTLTSGRVRTFYVKARFQSDAYQKADYYAGLASNDWVATLTSPGPDNTSSTVDDISVEIKKKDSFANVFANPPMGSK